LLLLDVQKDAIEKDLKNRRITRHVHRQTDVIDRLEMTADAPAPSKTMPRLERPRRIDCTRE